MSWKDSIKIYSTCPICGGRRFQPGPKGRLNQGIKPSCTGCSSLERHRIIFNAYKALGTDLLKQYSCLHFAPDRAVDPRWFGSYEMSTYEGENSLDLEAIDRRDGSYDWVICNHVLEHVADDARAMKEMLRIVKDDGVVQFAIPLPLLLEHTDDWGAPDWTQHGHFRVYGADFMDRFVGVLNDDNMLSVIGVDPVTGSQDVLFFACNNRQKLQTLTNFFV